MAILISLIDIAVILCWASAIYLSKEEQAK